ncbi:hypothetical protein AB0E55_21135 [Amycolatopsis keratiniphila]|uniref:hypothetical protein n=1 Tax=Amycolatopsis keratiniphila TaxID=129921 RepID=UPI0033C42B6F
MAIRVEELRLGDSEAPMRDTWGRAVNDEPSLRSARNLMNATCEGKAWRSYVEIAGASPSEPRTSGCQVPSDGMQPVFLERLLVAVEMRRRVAYRRLTVRNIIARENGVDGYSARALTGWNGDLASIPVKAIFGCRIETTPGGRMAGPPTVDLRFPKSLRKGERHEFVSLASDENLGDKRSWINVDVDHHGIAPSVVDGDGRVIAGLSVSVNFDDCVPDACWWYAEQNEQERVVRPPAGDRRLLKIRQGVVEHTFVESCRPWEEYGIAFCWPPS